MNFNLSIIVPVYNTEKYLYKCIDSILNQTYKNFELILVDDGSTDNSSMICDYFANNDGRICVIHKKNSGVMKARKVGLSQAGGKWISFLDSDDWIEPDFYNILFNFRQLENVDIIIKDGWQIEEVQSHKLCMGMREGIYYKDKIRKILIDGKMHPALWQKIFREDLIRKNISLIDNRVWKREDRLCSYACMLDAKIIFVQHGYQYHYVQHAASAMHRYDKMNIQNLYYLSQNIKKVRFLKKDKLCEQQWNGIILTELLEIIDKEFEKQNIIINRIALSNLKIKFKILELSKLLIGNEYKLLIRRMKIEQRIILNLFSLKWFLFLNFYLKVKNLKCKCINYWRKSNIE